MTRVLVTGATGLVGRHLVDRLLDRGDSVRALCRRNSQYLQLEKQGAEVVFGDLLEPASLQRATEGVQIIYHLAARPPLGGTPAEFIRDNVIGTENVIGVALRQSLSRFVHVSTVDVYGYSHHNGADETAPLIANGPYSSSKIESERVVMRGFNQHGLPVAVLRPCLIYGPFDRHLLPSVLKLLSLRRPPLVAGGRRLHDIVYAGDVAEAMILAAEQKAAVGQCYNIAGGQKQTAREILEMVSRITGKSDQFLHVPYRITYGASRALEPLSRWLRLTIPAYARWEVIKAMAHDRHFDITKARRELGYQPKMALETGLQRSWEWYLSTQKAQLRRPAAVESMMDI